jgi:hypothetical protein
MEGLKEKKVERIRERGRRRRCMGGRCRGRGRRGGKQNKEKKKMSRKRE